MVIWLGIAFGAPVLCDEDAATRLLDDARIPADRVPVTQPNLLPGLARADATPEVKRELDALCEAGSERLSMVEAERWESASWSAYSFVLTQSLRTECALVQDAVVLTVGIRTGEAPTYGIRSHLAPSTTPIADCGGTARYRQERVLDGLGTPVRLVLERTLEGGEDVGSRVLIRRASALGWHEQVLMDPAPPRLLDPSAEGPLLSLAGRESDPWIVAHSNRTTNQEDLASCERVRGQTVWRWADGEWRAIEGREALGRLADLGAWRLAGDDGWFLILAQDIENDRDLLRARMRRLQRRHPQPLRIRESASFPGMNAGFLIVSPDPWATQAEAFAARKSWGRRTGVYVKKGWNALDGCNDDRRRSTQSSR